MNSNNQTRRALIGAITFAAGAVGLNAANPAAIAPAPLRIPAFVPDQIRQSMRFLYRTDLEDAASGLEIARGWFERHPDLVTGKDVPRWAIGGSETGWGEHEHRRCCLAARIR